jgi:NAD(P)-dependent dehydrogenase (short-subunit alcohol dehydrogenase family)
VTIGARQVPLVGGSSVIAHALAQIYAKDGWTVIFAGRNNWELEIAAADTTIRHGTATRTLPMDANDPASVDAAAAALLSAGPLPHDLILAIGCSDEPSRAAYDPDHAERTLAANYGGVGLEHLGFHRSSEMGIFLGNHHAASGAH